MREAMDATTCDLHTSVSQFAEQSVALEAALPVERARLVALCAHLSGNAQVAEDLAQETLLVAWRHLDRLHTPAGLSLWLSAIARNVCRRYHSRRQQPTMPLNGVNGDDDAWDDAGEPADEGAGVEAQLDRAELATLLDRALALLPAETRAVLIERYIEESPHAEIAARLGLSEGAVKMRLRRGTLTLRQMLTRDEEALIGYEALVGASRSNGWQETAIWCPSCGRRHIQGRYDPEVGSFALRCPGCALLPDDATLAESRSARDIFGGVTGYKPAFSRLMASGHNFYRESLERGYGMCWFCGGRMTLHMAMPPMLLLHWQQQGIHLICEACGDISYISLNGLVLWLPEVRSFWKAHPRIAAEPPVEVEHDGVAALVTTFRSATDAAEISIVSATESYRVLKIATTGAAPSPERTDTQERADA